MTALPAEVEFGKVVGRFFRTLPDGPDIGSELDIVPTSGTVRFEPRVRKRRVLLPEPSTVAVRPVLCSLDPDGYLIDAQGAQGVWLEVGVWDVTFRIKGLRLSPRAIVVTEAHTALDPLDLAFIVPPGDLPLSAGQYGELSSRIEALELASDHGVLAGLADDDHPQYARADGSRGAFATTVQGAKADTAVQPAALVPLVTTSDPRLSDARTPTAHAHDDRYFTETETNTLLSGKAASSHTHGVSDLTATGTKDATTYLRGDNTWAAPPGGGGGGVTDHGALTGLADDDHPQYAKADGTRGAFAATSHTHTATAISDSTATGRSLLTAASAAVARSAISAAGTIHASAHGVGQSDAVTIAQSQVTNLVTDLSGKAASSHTHSAANVTDFAEAARDAVGAALVQGSGVIITVSDATDQIFIEANQSSATALGVVELATTAEATTGTDTQRAVTPAGVKAVADTKAAASHTHVATTDLTATGTKNSTTFLRGDNTWAVPAGGGGSTPDVRFQARSETSAPSTPIQLITAGGFYTVALGAGDLGAVDVNVGGGAWDGVNYTWTVPVSGTYLIAGTLRIMDSQTPRSTFFNMHTANADHPSGLWATMGGNNPDTMRSGRSHTRIVDLTSGSVLRLVAYSDGANFALNASSLSAILLRSA